MSVDHELHKQRIKDYVIKSGHDVVYHDGGAQLPSSPKITERNNDMMKKARVVSTLDKITGNT